MERDIRVLTEETDPDRAGMLARDLIGLVGDSALVSGGRGLILVTRIALTLVAKIDMSKRSPVALTTQLHQFAEAVTPGILYPAIGLMISQSPEFALALAETISIQLAREVLRFDIDEALAMADGGSTAIFNYLRIVSYVLTQTESEREWGMMPNLKKPTSALNKLNNMGKIDLSLLEAEIDRYRELIEEILKDIVLHDEDMREELTLQIRGLLSLQQKDREVGDQVLHILQNIAPDTVGEILEEIIYAPQDRDTITQIIFGQGES